MFFFQGHGTHGCHKSNLDSSEECGLAVYVQIFLQIHLNLFNRHKGALRNVVLELLGLLFHTVDNLYLCGLPHAAIPSLSNLLPLQHDLLFLFQSSVSVGLRSGSSLKTPLRNVQTQSSMAAIRPGFLSYQVSSPFPG